MVAKDVVCSVVHKDGPANQLLFFTFFAASMGKSPSGGWHVVITGYFVPRLDVVLAEDSFFAIKAGGSLGMR